MMFYTLVILSTLIFYVNGGYLNQLLGVERVKPQNFIQQPYQNSHFGTTHYSGGSSYYNGPYSTGISYQNHPSVYNNNGGQYQRHGVRHHQGGADYGGHDLNSNFNTDPNYQFKYGVEDEHTGDRKTQYEVRENGVVKGSYSLVEPDGSIRTVEYTADPIHGFRAVVHRTGEKSVSYGD